MYSKPCFQDRVFQGVPEVNLLHSVFSKLRKKENIAMVKSVVLKFQKIQEARYGVIHLYK